MELVTLQSTINTLNTAGTEDSWQINKNYKVLGGTITAYDANGAIIPYLVQDDITIEWRVNNTNFNVRNQQLSFMALRTILERPSKVEFDINNGQTMYFKATHVQPSGTTRNAVIITIKITLLLEEREQQ